MRFITRTKESDLSAADSKYSVELYNGDGVLLADLTGRANGRSVSFSRNEPEEITFSINLNELEDYARELNISVNSLLVPYSTEVLIRRGQSALVRGQVTYMETYLTADATTVSVRAAGFLSLFKDRYTGPLQVYTGEQATDIAWDLIDTSQTGTNASFGITRGLVATVGVHDREYKTTNIKDALQDLTRVQTAPFDFEITPDKVFNTYASIGYSRPEVIFEYPGNIKSMRVPNNATGVANQILAFGGGLDTAISTTVDNTDSQSNYKIRQKVITPNGVSDPATLTDKSYDELAAWAFPVEIPAIDVDGGIEPFLTDYGIGDFVTVRVFGHEFVPINAMYRIEKIGLTIDDQDNEDVSLTLGTGGTINRSRQQLADALVNKVSQIDRDVRELKTQE